MTEFKSYIFEKKEPPKKFPLIWIIIGLLGIMLLNYTSEFNNFWIYIISSAGVISLNWYNRYRNYKYWGKQDLNGYFTDEIKISDTEIKISDRTYLVSEIKSMEIVYNNIYGSTNWNGVEGIIKTNGETNLLVFTLQNDTTIRNNFKLASLDHAKQLFDLTESLKNKIQINNNWHLNYNA